ncbi:MAG: rhodanese-like domain-containing protein [Chloroflexi bacterium]|nr:rhodanese-like domain-containing protein [Chloroflexota bacterium]
MDIQTLILIAVAVVVIWFVAQRVLMMRSVVEVSVKEAQEKVKAGAAFIDVRQLAEFQSGHAIGAKLIPLHELSARVSEIPKNKAVVIICASGNRSATAAYQLTKLGYENVFSVRGGTGAWRNAGLPTTK